MQLTLWTYEGPPHVGAMRIATSMEGVHYVLHAPQGDTYADLLFTMIERRDKRPPVTYTTFQARDLGGDTAELVKTAVRDAYERFKPRAMLVGESCTAELIQDQPGSLAKGMNLPIPIVPLELPAYSKKENWGASETLYHLVRTLLLPSAPPPGTVKSARPADRRPRANLIGPSALGFRTRDDVREVSRLLSTIGVDVHTVVPLGATPEDILRMPEADFNICLYPEVGLTTCTWLTRTFGMPVVRAVPIGVGATRDFIAEVGAVAGIDVSHALDDARTGSSDQWSHDAIVRSGPAGSSRLPWYSRSVDSTYLTGKRVFVFGDATHALAAARIAKDELGFTLVGLGTYSREFAREVREAAKGYGLEAVISDDYLEVEAKITEAAPELVLGTQMERHIAKRIGVPCAVISTPIHVQDVPARHSPQMGWEGANVIFDTWVHPLMMGLEEHLLVMFREDFEFGGEAAPSHLHAKAPGTKATDAGAESASVAPSAPSSVVPTEPAESAAASPSAAAAPSPTSSAAAPSPPSPGAATATMTAPAAAVWAPSGEAELKKIPFFVRNKARKNTERYAAEKGIGEITVDTLYEAKAHYGR